MSFYQGATVMLHWPRGKLGDGRNAALFAHGKQQVTTNEQRKFAAKEPKLAWVNKLTPTTFQPQRLDTSGRKPKIKSKPTGDGACM
jgi:hypothetical protein